MCISSLSFFSVSFLIFNCSITSYAAERTENISSVRYIFDDKYDYDFTEKKQLYTDNYALGSLSIRGNIDEVTKKNGVPAYGVDSGVISFSYNYNGLFLDENENSFLIKDNGKKIDKTKKLDSKIGKGALVLLESSDQENWNLATNPIVDFFPSNPTGAVDFFTTSGPQLSQGCYYRLIVAYKMKIMTGTTKIAAWNKQKSETKEYAEVYEFYLCNNSGIISVHNLNVEEIDLHNEDYEIEVLKRGETLNDGDSTIKGFSIDKFGISYVVTVNGKEVRDGEEFTSPGKYVITTTTNLGKKKTQEIYIFNGGADKGFQTYFGDGLIQGKRVFREGDYPTYAHGAKAQIKGVSDSIPALSGTITNITTNKTITLDGLRSLKSYSLEEGEYVAELYSGNSTSGSFYAYTWHFNILGEDAKPYVNYYELMNSDRLSDFSFKHYEVSYQSTAGGYIGACFLEYEDAFEYAYDIEKRFLEKEEDGIYYKSIDNPNKKVEYHTDLLSERIKLTNALNKYARENVEISYFDPSEQFTYRTFNNDNGLLENIEGLTVTSSLKVFASDEDKDKQMNRKPYLNGFTFIQVGDYDVDKVDAYCKTDGQTYELEFGKPVENQLEVSGNYTMREMNKYGDILTYDACYMADNVTESIWEITDNGKTNDLSIDYSYNMPIEAESVTLKSIQNELDDNAIICVQSPEAYSFDIQCYISEAKGLTLYKKGKYKVKFVDRVGNEYEVTFEINGKAKYKSAMKKGCKSYTDLYNEIYVNKKESEELN